MATKKKASNDVASPSRPLEVNDLKRIPWRSIGPAIMGGRVSDMCFAPGDPKTVYVGYATGGLWRTKNLCTTFEPLFDKEVTSSIGSVACCDAPADWQGWEEGKTAEEKAKEGKGKIIWVGTGEGNGRNSSSWGNGVYRSTDGGKKWTHLGLEATHDIPRLAVHPNDPDTCYVAALGHLWGHNEERGLYKTTDGGKTWTKVLSIDEKTGCCDVAIHPTEPDTIYAAMYMRLRKGYGYQSGGPEGGIYRSKDGGKTWTKLAGGLPSQIGRVGLDIYAADPSKMIAVVESTESGANSIRDDRMRGGGVFRSDDGGDTWTRHSVRSPRAFYFSKIKFDPQNDQRVYMLGWTTEISDDGGKTFREGPTNILHADHHAILVNPTDSAHVIVGTDGGVYQSFDKGETWDFINTMATGQFYNIALDNSEPYRVMGGLQDNGSWIGPSATHKKEAKDDAMRIPETSLTNADWQVVFWGDGFHVAFDPTDSNTVYAEWQGGHITRIGIKDGSKKYLSPEAREGEPRHRYNWNSPFFVSPHDPTVIYHAANSVFKLTERGDKRAKISPDLTTKDPNKMETVGSNAETFCTLVSLAESPLTQGELWAGSDDGLIHFSPDDGATWTNVTPALVAGRYVSRLHPSAHVKGRCYATIDGRRDDDMRPCVLVTEDRGATWNDITSDLPQGWTAKVVREDLYSPEVLYVGVENGLYVSLNRGESWVRLHGKGLPTVPIDDIQQHPRESDLVLGTHGRSIYILDGARWISELTAETMAKPLHLFRLHPARPQWFLDYPGLWTHKVFRAQNPPTGLRIDYWLSAYTGEDVTIIVEDAAGIQVKKLSGGKDPGFNRVVWNLEPEEWLRAADQGEDPWVPFHVRPGTYKVTITCGDHKEVGTVEILPRA